MLKKLHQTCTVLVLGIGIVHTLATFGFYKRLSEAAVWFAGAGLAGIFIGLLNVELWESESSRLFQRLTMVANLLFVVWLGVAFATSPRGLPQLFVLVSGVGMATCALLKLRQARNI